MSQQDTGPDVIVGIDFGMTCTGVAYSCGPDWHVPKTIQKWPGRSLENKVATAVSYSAQHEVPSAWGFLTESRIGQNIDTKRDFKLFLDPEYQPNQHAILPPSDALRYFRDYLSCIYTFIQQYFTNSQPRWAIKNVEYVFSVPTTWKNPGMVAAIQRTIETAGFGSEPRHTAKVTLTEAEAAAIYAAKEDYKTSEVFMVCDAGGGTTDVNILKVVTSGLGVTKLKPLGHVEGAPIGSTLIDYKMANLIEHRLKLSGFPFQTDVAIIADEMVRDKLETFKCSFGTEASNLPFIPLVVPELPPGSDFPRAGIQSSTLMLPREDLQKVFDDMFDQLSIIIDQQLESLQKFFPRETVSYLILSGGLGSSPYLGQRLKKHYEARVNMHDPSVQPMRILYAAEPQLAVCHGLVIDRMQEVVSLMGTFAERCCRVNYGIIVREPYDRKRHAGAKVAKDTRDGKIWAQDRIHWLIKRGQTISVSEGIYHRYTAKFELGRERYPWKAKIVMSPLSSDELPDCLMANGGHMHNGVVEVCAVESQLQECDMKLKNRHWYNKGRQYWLADFSLKILIGPADLKFEVHGKDGKCNKDHEAIQVAWCAPRGISTEGIHEGGEVYIELGNSPSPKPA